MSDTTVTSGGIGLGGLSFVVLMVLKILGLIEMGWFWVLTSFLWVPILVLLSVMLFIAGLGAIGLGGAYGVVALQEWLNKR